MGILNATPDSFFAESRLLDNSAIDFQNYKHADIVDLEQILFLKMMNLIG